jgi:hypothetical protein
VRSASLVSLYLVDGVKTIEDKLNVVVQGYEPRQQSAINAVPNQAIQPCYMLLSGSCEEHGRHF